MDAGRPSDQPDRWIGRDVRIVIDRPVGSVHPRMSHMRYRVNYGFVPGTLAADGAEIDAYLLGIDSPVEEFTGRCIAILNRLNDTEDKLVVVPSGDSLSDETILESVRFQERYFEIVLLR